MLLRRLFSGICLLCFGVLTFQWEIEQGLMYQDMVRDRAPEVGWMAATDQALSGETPCSGCMKLSRQKVSAEEEEEMVSAGVASEELMSACSPCSLIPPLGLFSTYQPDTPLFRSRPQFPTRGERNLVERSQR